MTTRSVIGLLLLPVVLGCTAIHTTAQRSAEDTRPSTVESPARPLRIPARTPAGQTSFTAAPPETTSVVHARRNRLVGVGALLTAANGTIFMLEKDRWWRNPSCRFHFQTEFGYARDFDKLGHFYGTSLYAFAIARSFRWAGVGRHRAALLGSAIALAMQTHVEINDGFYPEWGFDVLDQLANTLGAAWFYAGERTGWAHFFDVRWSYRPNELREPADNLFDEITGSFTNNYNGHGYWISARVHDLLPSSAKPYWPQPLMLSAGVVLDHWVPEHAAETWARPASPGRRSYYLSLDLDYKRLGVPGLLGDLLNRYHAPAPALRLYPSPRLFLIFAGP